MSCHTIIIIITINDNNITPIIINFWTKTPHSTIRLLTDTDHWHTVAGCYSIRFHTKLTLAHFWKFVFETISRLTTIEFIVSPVVVHVNFIPFLNRSKREIVLFFSVCFIFYLTNETYKKSYLFMFCRN